MNLPLLSLSAAAILAATVTAQEPRVFQYGFPFPGSLGEPGLISDQLPEIGGFSNLRVHNGLPGAQNVMLMGLNPTQIPIFGINILVDPLLASLPMPPLDPFGSAELQIPIPPDPGLTGLSLAFQSLIIDPGSPAPLPIAHTNGLLWEFGFPGALPPPQIQNVFPLNGTEGTVINIMGSGFDPDPANNCVFLGDLDARAMVVAATPNQLTAIIGPVNQPSTSGDVRVVRGSGQMLPPNFFDSGLNQSASDPAMLLVASETVANVGFQTQFVPGTTVRATSLGAGTLSFTAQANWAGNFKIDIYVRNAAGWLTKDIHIPVNAVSMTFAECVNHIRAHLKSVLPNVNVSGSPATGTIVVSDPSFGPATTGSITG